MLDITPRAFTELESCFKSPNKKAVVRIFLNEKGCHGPSLKMMLLDDADPVKDDIFEYAQFSIAVNRDLMANLNGLKLDYIPGLNFKMTAGNPEIGTRCMGCYVGVCINNAYAQKKPSVSPFVKKSKVDKI